MSYNAALTMVSRNGKTGPIPVSTTTKATCALVCPFRKDQEGGCYAEGGPLAIFWSQVTSGKFGTDWSTFVSKIAKLRPGTLWRHNQGGDLPGDGVRIDRDALGALVKANKRKQGFTYTHYNVTNLTDNRDAVADANAEGFTINLSGNNMRHADQLAALDIAPVVVVLPVETQRTHTKGGEWTESLEDYRKRVPTQFTPQGRKVVVCPATYRDDVACSTCALCARKREAIVGFPAHGASKRKADAIAMA